MPKTSVGGNYLLFHYFRVSKKIPYEGGSIKFSVEKFLSHNAKHFRMGESFSVSLNSGMEKVWIREGGEYQDFSSKVFLSRSFEEFP